MYKCYITPLSSCKKIGHKLVEIGHKTQKIHSRKNHALTIKKQKVT